MSELIMDKLGSRGLSPAMQDVVLRAKSAGLHKIAATMRGQEEFTFRNAILELSTKLAYDHLKQQKIASGMCSLRALEASGAIKLSSMARMPQPGQNAMTIMEQIAKKSKGAPAPMPATLGGGQGIAGALTPAQRAVTTTGERFPMGRLPVQ